MNDAQFFGIALLATIPVFWAVCTIGEAVIQLVKGE